jgi:hypothetical protein
MEKATDYDRLGNDQTGNPLHGRTQPRNQEKAERVNGLTLKLKLLYL